MPGPPAVIGPDTIGLSVADKGDKIHKEARGIFCGHRGVLGAKVTVGPLDALTVPAAAHALGLSGRFIVSEQIAMPVKKQHKKSWSITDVIGHYRM